MNRRSFQREVVPIVCSSKVDVHTHSVTGRTNGGKVAPPAPSSTTYTPQSQTGRRRDTYHKQEGEGETCCFLMSLMLDLHKVQVQAFTFNLECLMWWNTTGVNNKGDLSFVRFYWYFQQRWGNQTKRWRSWSRTRFKFHVLKARTWRQSTDSHILYPLDDLNKKKVQSSVENDNKCSSVQQLKPVTHFYYTSRTCFISQSLSRWWMESIMDAVDLHYRWNSAKQRELSLRWF